ncbi:MAG: quinone-dependent dihydroorotate dehydrogenase [Pseudomonadota bacterium]|nr:quinone-dependent dihydroorotate dehydrogenase [Pseudomonadota bacterium]
MNYLLLRKFLFLFDPETAHGITMWLLRCLARINLVHYLAPPLQDDPCKILGLNFRNRVGIAAGLDKGENINALGQLGVGFIEVGGVTPKPQPGNPRPRIFRLLDDEGLINRMGFNNSGVDELVNCLKRRNYEGIVGVNITKNKDTPLDQAGADYVLIMERVYPYVDYIAVNISSPNTPGLRELQTPAYLYNLLSGLKGVQQRLAKQYEKYVPLVVKIAPDLTDTELTEMATTLLDVGIDGVIATNTSLSREGLKDPLLAKEAGGLSGKPLSTKSTEIIGKLFKILQHRIPIIASGGVMSAEDAKAKRAAGAELVQVYTGLIYHGPVLLSDIANS